MTLNTSKCNHLMLLSFKGLISRVDGRELAWVDEILYFGVYTTLRKYEMTKRLLIFAFKTETAR